MLEILPFYQYSKPNMKSIQQSQFEIQALKIDFLFFGYLLININNDIIS